MASCARCVLCPALLFLHTSSVPCYPLHPVSEHLPPLLAAPPNSHAAPCACAAQVFRPSHILPTLTVEQQGAIELAQARDREAAERQRTEAARLQAEERRGRGGGDEEEDEEELAKARAWDDWKDHHRRGEGNSKLTPCG